MACPVALARCSSVMAFGPLSTAVTTSPQLRSSSSRIRRVASVVVNNQHENSPQGLHIGRRVLLRVHIKAGDEMKRRSLSELRFRPRFGRSSSRPTEWKWSIQGRCHQNVCWWKHRPVETIQKSSVVDPAGIPIPVSRIEKWSEMVSSRVDS